jgi:extracellular elastinolytic metalloproteinase
VTNRLVGGPANDRALEAPQSGGMGEGWGDYIACTINNVNVVGDWVVNDSAGIRDFPYDSAFPDHFGKMGTGRYNEEHNIGEIWCATLMEMNRNIGANLGVQLVVDALKLTPANPSFLDGRDAILAALDAMRQAGRLTSAQFDNARDGIWKAFAKFGMGPAAQSNGATLSGVVADFNVPPPTAPPPPASGVRVEAAPNLNIPDDQPAGVSHVLAVPQAGRIKRLTVSVDIEHTWVGDLRVSLATPSGKTVVLHDRKGGSQKNLVVAYRSEDVLALADLLGDQAQGNWTLRLADMAGQDVGRLRRWSLEFDLETAAGTSQGEATPALAIPDNNPAGVSSSIAIAQSGTVRGIKVNIDITHSWIGDLRVELVAPSGQAAILHDQSGNSEDNIIRTYDSVTSPGLTALAGQTTQGNWQLRVKDLAAQDIGKLNKWSLELTLGS